ncbi:hypothetical protein F2Q69_00014092 [Brassica cretica]|uniref:Uncharacterized protein n=1 Tax=Brassica cretica TaxID=69181 RepID=A0A8S9QQV5_BRACR|nr:hypothetical protein F2Q69_00014092 [Brassica cretica]
MPVLFKGGQSTPSSLVDGRPGSTTRPARRMAELDRPHDHLGRSTGWTSPVRQTDELDRLSHLHPVLVASPPEI